MESANTNEEKREMLSPHFSLTEMTLSGTALIHGIENTSPAEAVENMRMLCVNVLEPLRQRFGKIRVTSGYRCDSLNKLVKGSATSQHLRGEAADLHVSDMDVARKMCHFIERNLTFDQLLLEHSRKSGARWIHVSYRHGRNRRESSAVTV